MASLQASLLADDVAKKLVFETHQSHCEVDDCHLDANLREVVRIGHLCCQEHLKVLVVVDVRVTKAYQSSIAFGKQRLGKYGLECRLERLANVLSRGRQAGSAGLGYGCYMERLEMGCFGCSEAVTSMSNGFPTRMQFSRLRSKFTSVIFVTVTSFFSSMF